MIELWGGPAGLTINSLGFDADQLAGLRSWAGDSLRGDAWSEPVEVSVSLAHNLDAARYRERFADYIDFPNLEWLPSERRLSLDLPTSLAKASCWTMCLAHRHALLAGLVAASQGSDWRCFHAALAILSDGRSVLVIGHSGAGKSTLVRRLSADLRGDEVVAVRSLANGFEARGTAVPGELRCHDFSPHPLAAIVLPGHGQSPKVCLEPLAASQAMRELLSATIRFKADALLDDFDWLDKLVRQVPVVRLSWHLLGELPALPLQRFLARPSS